MASLLPPIAAPYCISLTPTKLPIEEEEEEEEEREKGSGRPSSCCPLSQLHFHISLGWGWDPFPCKTGVTACGSQHFPTHRSAWVGASRSPAAREPRHSSHVQAPGSVETTSLQPHAGFPPRSLVEMQEMVLRGVKSKKQGADVGLARTRLAPQHPNEERVGVLHPALGLGTSGLLPTVFTLRAEKEGKVGAKPSGTFVTGTGRAPSVAQGGDESPVGGTVSHSPYRPLPLA